MAYWASADPDAYFCFSVFALTVDEFGQRYCFHVRFGGGVDDFNDDAWRSEGQHSSDVSPLTDPPLMTHRSWRAEVGQSGLPTGVHHTS